MSGQDEALFPVPDAAVLLQVEDLAQRVDALEILLDDEPARAGYKPSPAPKWWLLKGDERAKAVDRLAAWVDRVYRPSYGHLAARLPACWREHPLCLYVLDYLSELHSVHYSQDKRSASGLASQAEFHIRHLPSAAELMAAEAQGCKHQIRPVSGAAR